MTLTARQFVVEMLAARRSAQVSVSGMIRGGRALGLADNAVRVAIARLKSDGYVTSVRRGVYRLGPEAEPVFRRVNAWRNVDERLVDWDGTWLAVCDAPLSRSDRKAVRRRDRAYRLMGFRELVSGMQIRPNNLEGGVEAARTELQRLGVAPEAPVFAARDFEEGPLRRVIQEWNVRKLEKEYASLIRQIRASQERLHEKSIPEACRETFLIGRRAIRTVVLDPLLPEPLIKSQGRSELVEIMGQYDERAHPIWEQLLEPGTEPAQ